jgi:hypothetical protein
MPDVKKIDPFKPAQPNIPGVTPSSRDEEPPASDSAPQPYASERGDTRARVPWSAVAVVVAILTIGGLVYWARGSSPKPTQPSPEEAAPSAAIAPETPKPPEKLPVGPGAIATTDDLTKAWSAKRFLFRDPLTTEPVPAMVVRLPGGEYWGLSLREPFGTCELEYVSDLQKLQTNYDFHASHPMVVNPCTRAVYDLMRYSGGAPDGGLVRGDIVAGTGIRPPMAIEIRIEGKVVRALRME